MARLGNVRQFGLRELQAATDGFSAKNILGKGGFGNVYRGRLPDGTTVAVKRLKDPSASGEAQFRTEVEMISLAVHRHLLRLVGFCADGGERLLVYPYMPNGSVASRLRGTFSSVTYCSRIAVAIGTTVVVVAGIKVRARRLHTRWEWDPGSTRPVPPAGPARGSARRSHGGMRCTAHSTQQSGVVASPCSTWRCGRAGTMERRARGGDHRPDTTPPPHSRFVRIPEPPGRRHAIAARHPCGLRRCNGSAARPHPATARRDTKHKPEAYLRVPGSRLPAAARLAAVVSSTLVPPPRREPRDGTRQREACQPPGPHCSCLCCLPVRGSSQRVFIAVL